MSRTFQKIRDVINESKVNSSDVVAFGKAATNNENLNDLKKRFEKIIKLSGFYKSFKRVNVIGYGKIIAYYGDAREAKKFEEWSNKQFKNTKLIVVYKDLHVGESRAGIIFDFNRM